MSSKKADIIENMRSSLYLLLEEWVGGDVPAEGTEDYETWQSKLDDIAGIKTIDDVIDYVGSTGANVDDFLISGEYEVITAGMDANLVPIELVTQAGELIAERLKPSGALTSVYLFDTKYFIFSETGQVVAQTETDALNIAEIDTDVLDDSESPQIYLSPEVVSSNESMEKKASTNHPRSGSRPVVVIVTDWPSGSMAFKFGDALRSSLRVEKEDMVLLQMSPERIFRVETHVSESEFREDLRSRDVASGGAVLFIDIH